MDNYAIQFSIIVAEQEYHQLRAITVTELLFAEHQLLTKRTLNDECEKSTGSTVARPAPGQEYIGGLSCYHGVVGSTVCVCSIVVVYIIVRVGKTLNFVGLEWTKKEATLHLYVLSGGLATYVKKAGHYLEQSN